jgi:hypothetical protein
MNEDMAKWICPRHKYVELMSTTTHSWIQFHYDRTSLDRDDNLFAVICWDPPFCVIFSYFVHNNCRWYTDMTRVWIDDYIDDLSLLTICIRPGLPVRNRSPCLLTKWLFHECLTSHEAILYRPIPTNHFFCLSNRPLLCKLLLFCFLCRSLLAGYNEPPSQTTLTANATPSDLFTSLFATKSDHEHPILILSTMLSRLCPCMYKCLRTMIFHEYAFSQPSPPTFVTFFYLSILKMLYIFPQSPTAFNSNCSLIRKSITYWQDVPSTVSHITYRLATVSCTRLSRTRHFDADRPHSSERCGCWGSCICGTSWHKTDLPHSPVQVGRVCRR